MTSPRNDEIQSSIISYLKSVSAIYNLLITWDNASGTTEIREDQWQGTEFDYPNIRVRMVDNKPITDNPDCSATLITVSIMSFSQDASSWEADKIAGIISTSVSGKTFTKLGVEICIHGGLNA
jgi:hypothetical protein